MKRRAEIMEEKHPMKERNATKERKFMEEKNAMEERHPMEERNATKERKFMEEKNATKEKRPMEEKHTIEDTKLGAVESRFADIIWQQEPLSSGELVKLCGEELGWKKSTTYTVLKKLCERGIFRNQDGQVTSLISRQDFHAAQSRKFVEDTFQGSLPAFIAAFASQKRLSREEIREILGMIDSYEEGR